MGADRARSRGGVLVRIIGVFAGRGRRHDRSHDRGDRSDRSNDRGDWCDNQHTGDVARVYFTDDPAYASNPNGDPNLFWSDYGLIMAGNIQILH
jgi:hypothetical protein